MHQLTIFVKQSAARAKAREARAKKQATRLRRAKRRQRKRAKRAQARKQKLDALERVNPALAKVQGSIGQNAMTRVTSNWNIADYLPQEVGQLFVVIAAEFVAKPVDMRTAIRRERELEKLAKATGSQMITSSQAILGTGTVGGAAEREADARAEEKFLKFFVTNSLTSRMMKRYIPQINVRAWFVRLRLATRSN